MSTNYANPSQLSLQLSLQSLLRRLHDSLPVDPSKPVPYHRSFVPLITLWYLIFQRLNPDSSLQAVVIDALGGGAAALARPGQPSNLGLKSSQTSSYSDARQRLDLSWVQEIFRLSCRIEAGGQEIQLPDEPPLQIMDGTMVGMLTNPALSAVYPPAANQNGVSCWSQIRCVGLFGQARGEVRDLAYGPVTTSEQALCWELLAWSRPGSITLMDRNFGVYSVVQAAAHHQQHVLVRMTQSRAKKLAGDREMVPGEDRLVTWSPSPNDQLCPDAPSEPVQGRLILVELCRKGFPPMRLWLFTTLIDAHQYPVQQLVEWYGLRWQVEIGMRHLKSAMGMKELRARTPEMAVKELYAGMIAHNLVCMTRQACARRLGVSCLSLSYQGARRLLWNYIRGGLNPFTCPEGMLKGLCLPRRSAPREPEPRMIRQRPRSFPPMRGSRQKARETLAKRNLQPES